MSSLIPLSILACYSISLIVTWKTIRVLQTETTRLAKTSKLVAIPFLLRSNMLLVIGVSLGAIVQPSTLLPAIGAALIAVIQVWQLLRKRRELTPEIIELHRNEAVIGLNLGTDDGTLEGTPIYIWFKEAQAGVWPPIELEVGAGIFSMPVNDTPTKTIQTLVVPKLEPAFDLKEMRVMFAQMRDDLSKYGVTHRIDIKGWDYHPTLQKLVENILDPQPPPQTP